MRSHLAEHTLEEDAEEGVSLTGGSGGLGGNGESGNAGDESAEGHHFGGL